MCKHDSAQAVSCAVVTIGVGLDMLFFQVEG